jgi:hypothetical protein
MAVTTMIWMELEIRAQWRHGAGLGPRLSRRAGPRAGARRRVHGAEADVVSRRVGNAIARAQSLEGDVRSTRRGRCTRRCSPARSATCTCACPALAADQKQRLLVRLMIEDPNLQAVPWEALCRPQSNLGFLAARPTC